MGVENLTFGHFHSWVGDGFRAEHEDGPVDLELTEAVQTSGENRPDEAFSLVFRGPPEPFLPQRIYVVEHDQMGAVQIFLVPVGQVPGGFLYEAVFTRLD